MKHFKPGQLITVKSHDLPNVRIIVRVLENPKDTKLFYTISTKTLSYADVDYLYQVYGGHWPNYLIPVKKFKIIFLPE